MRPLRAPGHGVEAEGDRRTQRQQIAPEHGAGHARLEAGQYGHTGHGHQHAAPLAAGDGFLQEQRREEGDEDRRRVDDGQRMGDGGEAEAGDVAQEVHGSDEAEDDEARQVGPGHAQALAPQGHQGQDAQRGHAQAAGGDLVGRQGRRPAGQHRAGGEEQDGQADVEQPAAFLTQIKALRRFGTFARLPGFPDALAHGSMGTTSVLTSLPSTRTRT